MASKYDVKSLVRLCQNSICEKIGITNAAETFLAVHQHPQAQQIKKYVLDFIVQNYQEVRKTPGFALIRQLPSANLVEIMDRLATSEAQ